MEDKLKLELELFAAVSVFENISKSLTPVYDAKKEFGFIDDINKSRIAEAYQNQNSGEWDDEEKIDDAKDMLETELSIDENAITWVLDGLYKMFDHIDIAKEMASPKSPEEIEAEIKRDFDAKYNFSAYNNAVKELKECEDALNSIKIEQENVDKRRAEIAHLLSLSTLQKIFKGVKEYALKAEDGTLASKSANLTIRRSNLVTKISNYKITITNSQISYNQAFRAYKANYSKNRSFFGFPIPDEIDNQTFYKNLNCLYEKLKPYYENHDPYDIEPVDVSLLMIDDVDTHFDLFDELGEHISTYFSLDNYLKWAEIPDNELEVMAEENYPLFRFRSFIDESHRFQPFTSIISKKEDISLTRCGQSIQKIVERAGLDIRDVKTQHDSVRFEITFESEMKKAIEEANSVVDDNFKSIVAGVKEGRVAFANIRKIKALLAILATNVPFSVDTVKISAMAELSRTTLLQYFQYLIVY